MCPKLIELLSWNGPTVHVCCFMLARASTKTFVSRVQKTAKKFSSAENSLAGSLVSRGIAVLRRGPVDFVLQRSGCDCGCLWMHSTWYLSPI